MFHLLVFHIRSESSVSLKNNIVLEIENNGVASISLSTGHRNSMVKMKCWKDGNRGFVRSASKRLIIASLAAPLRFHVRECLASNERVGGGNLVACNRVSCSRNVKTCEEGLINSIKTLSGYSIGNVILQREIFSLLIRYLKRRMLSDQRRFSHRKAC